MENSPEVLGIRVTSLERVVKEVADSVKSIDQSLKTLARLEVKHEETRSSVIRAFQEINDHETRLRDIEAEMPTVKLVRNWIIAGVVGMLGLAGLAIWAVISK